MRIRTAVLCVFAVTTLSVTACTPGSGSPGSSATPSTVVGAGSSATVAAGGGRDGCLTGTWSVDVTDLASQVAAKMQSRAARGSAEGTLTVLFGDNMTIKYGNTLIITVPNDPTTIVFKETFTGNAVSTDWSAKDGKLAGSMPADTVKTKIDMTVGGKQVPSTITQLSGTLDLASGAIGYTCDGSKATLTSGVAVWKLTRA
jgi:hypothetical protein